MILLLLCQREQEHAIGLFKSLENMKEFVKTIPGYFQSDEADYISFQALENYDEIEYKGNRIPLSKFMFHSTEDIFIDWREYVFLDEMGSGIIEGCTLVDAYNVPNEEVRDYILQREQRVKDVTQIFSELGYETERAYHGSEDGEALLFRKQGSEQWHFFDHLDPLFVEELPVGKELREFITEYLRV